MDKCCHAPIVKCLECGEEKAVLTYEENRVYRVKCNCGYQLEFKNRSLDGAVTWHNKIVELDAENARLQSENAQLRKALSDMWFAYENKDEDCPHDFEKQAVKQAENLIGKWEDVMIKEDSNA